MAVWICTYHDHAGACARATFDTRDMARQFAERHAHAVAPTGTPIKWEDTGDVTVLTTQRGGYVITSGDAYPTRLSTTWGQTLERARHQ
jgi:hypothetical protein